MNDTSLFAFEFPRIGGLMATHYFPYFIGIALVTLTTYTWATSNPSLKKLPHINPPGFFSNAQSKHDFRRLAKTMIQKARKHFPNQPYRMTTDFGEVVMLQSEWFQEIRNNPHLSFIGTIAEERICEIPGFEPLATLGEDGMLVQIIATKQLTRSINQVTEPLSEEIALSLSINMGESTDWHEIQIMPALRDVTARMSSRVFLGKELARSAEWLEITTNYTNITMMALAKLTNYYPAIRPYVGRFFPESRRVQTYYKRARALIDPVMEKRAALKRAAIEAGQPEPIYNDALEWIAKESKEHNFKCDVANFQLMISVVAISTTSDLLQCTLINLIKHPETMQAARDEIAHVLKTEGWRKTSLYSMKLLDSILKESQRIKPFFSAMRRAVEEDITLADGTLIKKGSRIHIDTHRMVDPEVYENPEEWKGSRFLDLRSQPGKEHVAQLVTTSVDHIGFGHGKHACPGRFFAANELKIALCHLLLKYDWKLAPGTPTDDVNMGFSQRVNPFTKVLCRRRTSMEVDIDSI
ncbi:cytochrome P450 monooxygenase [Xylaria bambusicola]|uniref:cytochrome P450 monooxygenase n=1 Tax=Xylaria bambusicola TaxID=326684 RepID=UPI002008BE3E|nr:cytochrome P450 monooxygenase [Xylaria bambusicola]KAI0518117.1 cytochrome P450 monooxygenase [Xylaria bambusicola]